MPYVPVTDPKLARLYARAEALLRGAPTSGAEGYVEIRQFRDPAGRAVYVVGQRYGDGGWGSPQTYSLAEATLAAEILAIANNSELLVCAECDAAEEGGAK